MVNVDRRVNFVELGYCFGRCWWNYGYVIEMVKVVMFYLFDIVKVNKVEVCYDLVNIVFGRVMEKVGMVIEGLW